jgi:hypothetical protein
VDYRCPHCGHDLKSRRIVHALVAAMESECSRCKRRIKLNIHPAETLLVLVCFAAMALLGTLAYRLQSERLALLTFVAAMAGAAAVPLLERTLLRRWPRYVARA